MDHIKLTVDKLSVDAVSELVISDKCGAVSIFVGTTRDSFEGKKVLRLEYEAYEAMAVKAMKEICDEVRKKWPVVHGIAIYHRLGNVPCREASVVIAVSSPHRRDSLDAVSHCIELLKAKVPIWKKEVYEGETAAWKENAECSPIRPEPKEEDDKNLVQITVSNEELQRRIQSFIDRKREQVNWSNIRDFIPSYKEGEEDTCARVRTQFVRRSDSKGHLKMRKVNNEWGPQTVSNLPKVEEHMDTSLPQSISERVTSVEKFLNITPVSKDVYKRLKEMEDKIIYLQSISPEYAQFWNKTAAPKPAKERLVEYAFSAEDIERKIEELERQSSTT